MRELIEHAAFRERERAVEQPLPEQPELARIEPAETADRGDRVGRNGVCHGRVLPGQSQSNYMTKSIIIRAAARSSSGWQNRAAPRTLSRARGPIPSCRRRAVPLRRPRRNC